MKILFAIAHHYHGYDLLEALGNRNDIPFIFNGINADKFLSTPAANGVGFPDMAAHGLGEVFQDFIACLMAVGFIKIVKVVDIRKSRAKGSCRRWYSENRVFSTASRKSRFGSLVRAS